MMNHIHRLLMILPKFSVANTIVSLKGKSAIKYLPILLNSYTISNKSLHNASDLSIH